MKLQEHRRWSYFGGAVALFGLLGAALATRYSISSAELHPAVFAGLILFVAALPIIGIGSLLEGVATGRFQIKLGYITALVSIAVGSLILLLALLTSVPRIAQHLGLVFAAVILVSGTVNLLCARIARLLRTLRPAGENASATSAGG